MKKNKIINDLKKAGESLMRIIVIGRLLGVSYLAEIMYGEENYLYNEIEVYKQKQ